MLCRPIVIPFHRLLAALTSQRLLMGMRRAWAAAAVGCAVLAWCTGARAAAPVAGRVNQNTWMAHLENGVVAIFRHVEGAPTVSVRAFVRGGSVAEGEYAGSGINYLLERVVLGGSTENREASESVQLLRRIGAGTESYTTKNTTVFHLQTPAPYLGEGLTLLSDWLFHCRLQPEEVARAKSEIARQQVDNARDPLVRLQDVFFKTLFQTHPVRNPVMGYLEPLLALDDISLIGHYKRTYVTDRVVLVLGGDFSGGIKEPLGLVESTFGVVERRAATLWVPPPENRQGSARYLALEGRDKNSRVMLGWHTTGAEEVDNDFYALEVLSGLLGLGKSSLLGSLTQGKDAPASRAVAYHISPVEGLSAFMVHAEVKGGGPDPFLAKFYQGLTRLREDGPEPEALELARKQLVARLVLPQQDAAAITERTGEDYLRHGDPEFQEVYRREVERVEPGDVKRVLERYLTPSRQTLVLEKPGGAELENAGPAKAAPKKAALVTLKNGLRVALWQTADTQAVSIQAFVRGGELHETEETSGAFRLLSKLFTKGSEHQTAQEQQAALAALGADLEASSGLNSLGAGLTVVRADLEAGVNLLFEAMARPNLSPGAIQEGLAELAGEEQQVEGHWKTLAVASLKEHFWGKHPFGRPVYGSAASRAKLTAETLKKLSGGYFTGPNMTVAVFGNFDQRELISVMEDTFGTLPDTAAPLIKPQARPEEKGKRVRVDGPPGHLLVGHAYPGLGLDDERLPAALALTALLGGLGAGNGVLQDTLIEQKTVADYVNLEYQPALGEGAVYLVAHATPEKERELQSALDNAIKEIRDNPPDEGRLAYTRDLLVNQRRQSADSLEERARATGLHVLLGQGLDEEERLLKAVEAVTPAQVQEVARRLLNDPLRLIVAPAP